MRKVVLFLSTLLFIASALTGFADIFITYKSGDCKVDRRGNGKWKDALVDMDLSETSVIQTGPDGEVEIEVDGEIVSIGNNRVVALSELLDKIGKKKKLGWLKNMALHAVKMSSEQETSSRTAIAGVRGEKPGETGVDWLEDVNVSEEEEEEFQKGKAYFEEGKYSEAIQLFSNIVDREERGGLRDEAAFYLGVSLFNNLQYKEAQSYLSEIVLDKEAYYYEMALVHYSTSHYLLANFEEAIEGFKIYTKDFAQGSMRPYVIFMLGKSYKDIGKKQEARRYFNEVKEKYRDTDVYDDTLAEMKEL